jgi:hypothetical protein
MLKSVVAKRLILIFLACSATALALPSLRSAQQPDKTETLKRARQSYYSLKDEGLTEFRCTMSPNWPFLLADQRKADPTGIDAAIQKLQALHFGLSLGLDGNAKVTHNDLAAENERVASGLKQVYTGMEQMASGFFQTWSAYTISPALPDLTTTFQLEEVGPDYRISYKDGAADVTTTMGADYAISVMRVKTAEFDSTIKPQGLASLRLSSHLSWRNARRSHRSGRHHRLSGNQRPAIPPDNFSCGLLRHNALPSQSRFHQLPSHQALTNSSFPGSVGVRASARLF